MRYRLPAALIVAAGLMSPGIASAENPSFDFVELRLGQIDVKNSSANETGPQLGFSYGFSPKFHFFLETGQYGDIDVWNAGFGWRKATSENTTLYFEYGHMAINDTTAVDVDGKTIEVGFRSRPGEIVEVGFSLQHRDMGATDEARFGLSARWYATDRISFGLSADSGEETDEFAATARVDFGG